MPTFHYLLCMYLFFFSSKGSIRNTLGGCIKTWAVPRKAFNWFSLNSLIWHFTWDKLCTVDKQVSVSVRLMSVYTVESQNFDCSPSATPSYPPRSSQTSSKEQRNSIPEGCNHLISPHVLGPRENVSACLLPLFLRFFLFNSYFHISALFLQKKWFPRAPEMKENFIK